MNNIIICTNDPKLVPTKKTSGAICRDMYIAEDITVQPGELITVSAGFKVYIPNGRQAKFYARSGLPVKSGLMQANAVAIMDSGYRGEYIIQLFNFTKQTVTYDKYSRLTQLEFLPAYQPELSRYGTEHVPGLDVVVDDETFANFAELYPSERGEGRFHSTGR